MTAVFCQYVSPSGQVDWVSTALTMLATHDGPVPLVSNGVIAVSSGGSYPGHVREIAVLDVRQDLRRVENNLAPVGSRTDNFLSELQWAANMVDRIGSDPNPALYCPEAA